MAEIELTNSCVFFKIKIGIANPFINKSYVIKKQSESMVSTLLITVSHLKGYINWLKALQVKIALKVFRF